jgi:hypothetical protein
MHLRSQPYIGPGGKYDHSCVNHPTLFAQFGWCMDNRSISMVPILGTYVEPFLATLWQPTPLARSLWHISENTYNLKLHNVLMLQTLIPRIPGNIPGIAARRWPVCIVTGSLRLLTRSATQCQAEVVRHSLLDETLHSRITAQTV